VHLLKFIYRANCHHSIMDTSYNMLMGYWPQSLTCNPYVSEVNQPDQ